MRKTPHTGLDHTERRESAAAPHSDRRAHTQAATASARPRVNGIRPITTLLMTPARNSQAASAPAAGVAAQRRERRAKSQTAATAATTPTRRGAGAPPPGGEGSGEAPAGGAPRPLRVPRGEAGWGP